MGQILTPVRLAQSTIGKAGIYMQYWPGTQPISWNSLSMIGMHQYVSIIQGLFRRWPQNRPVDRSSSPCSSSNMLLNPTGEWGSSRLYTGTDIIWWGYAKPRCQEYTQGIWWLNCRKYCKQWHSCGLWGFSGSMAPWCWWFQQPTPAIKSRVQDASGIWLQWEGFEQITHIARTPSGRRVGDYGEFEST